MDVRRAIEAGDAELLRALLAERSERANELVVWGARGEIRTHPLHYVSDALFNGVLERGREGPLMEVLLAAGADANHQAPNGETPLIGAASLGAEEVGLRLLEAGARVDARGGFGETALHWAAHVGLERLSGRLIGMGADVNVRDARYGSPPIGWALHGWENAAPGSEGRQREVVRALVLAGAAVEPEWVRRAEARGDDGVLRALRG